MKKWDVILPICGHVQVTVEAETKDMAILIAMDRGGNSEDKDVWLQWEYYEHAEGFVNSFPSPYYPEAEESKDQ